MAGQIPLAVVDLPSALQQIKAGKLIAYAVTSRERLPMLPDVPTVAEAGLPGYDSTGWFGVVAPADTPAPVVARLNAEINAALNDETGEERDAQPRRGAGAGHGEGFRRLHPRRNEEVGQGHQDRQHQARLKHE